MAISGREDIRSLKSDAAGPPHPTEFTGEEMLPETDPQETLFSEMVISLCYWSTVVLLAVAGAGLLYWPLRHSGLAVAPVTDPFGITTPPWVMLSLPPIGVVASLGQAVWCAVRGRRVWNMLMTAATLIAVTVCEVRL
jgi:hypothetical protein